MKSQINLFGVGVGQPSKSLTVTAAKRVNVYYDIQPAPGDKVQVAAFGTPGCAAWLTMPDPLTPVRGIYLLGDGSRMFVVQNDTLYEVTTGSAVSRGTISAGTEIVEMADNGTQVLLATGYNTYLFTLSTNVLSEVYFGSVLGDYIPMDSVTFQDGYFIGAVNGSQGDPAGFYLSQLYNGGSWDPLDFGVAEYLPDGLVKVVAKNGVLYLFGSRSTEVWQNIGDLNFPYQRVAGTTSDYGLVNKESLAHLGTVMLGLFRNRQNDLAVCAMQGYQPQTVTPSDLADRLRLLANPDDCAAFGYSMAGHDFYQISWETDGITLLYDSTTNLWSELKSGAADRHVARLGAPYFLSANMVMTDYIAGRLLLSNPDLHSDDGVTNHRELIGNHVFLPDRGAFRIISIQMDMENGTAPAGTTVEVRLSLSKDGGHTWSEEYPDTSLTGEYARVHKWSRLGRGRDIVPKIRMTDPAKFCLLGAVADIQPFGW